VEERLPEALEFRDPGLIKEVLRARREAVGGGVLRTL
jgi:hypothetical protein